MLKKYIHLIVYGITLVILVLSISAVVIAFKAQMEIDTAVMDTREEAIVSVKEAEAPAQTVATRSDVVTIKFETEEESALRLIKENEAAAAAQAVIQNALREEAEARGQVFDEDEAWNDQTGSYSSSDAGQSGAELSGAGTSDSGESDYSDQAWDNGNYYEDADDSINEADNNLDETADEVNDVSDSASDYDGNSGNYNSDYGISSGIYSYSASDLNYLVWCVSAEVGWSPYETQLAVANVILDRAANAGSIYGAVYAPGQFSVTWNGAIERAMANGPRATTLEAVQDALNGADNRARPYYYFNNVYMGYTGEWIGDEYFYLVS